jgi:hypothetical protein
MTSGGALSFRFTVTPTSQQPQHLGLKPPVSIGQPLRRSFGQLL